MTTIFDNNSILLYIGAHFDLLWNFEVRMETKKYKNEKF